VPRPGPAGKYQLIVMKGGSELGLAIRAELLHTLVTEIGCVGKVIHFLSLQYSLDQLRYSIVIFILMQEFFTGWRDAPLSLRR